MQPRTQRRLLPALEAMPEIRQKIGGRVPGFFLDFDGTLAPIVGRPHLAVLPEGTRSVLRRLAAGSLVCFLSGRGLEDLRSKVGVEKAFYAANHGLEIIGPPGSNVVLGVGLEHRAELSTAVAQLEQTLHAIAGVVLEDKGLSVSVHYRLVRPQDRSLVERAVAEVAMGFPSLRLTLGKMVLELRPSVAWNKGRAMLWLLERLGFDRIGTCPVCLGDDLTDEDMFLAAEGRGVNIVVGRPERPTYADYRLRDSGESESFLSTFVTSGSTSGLCSVE